ncbi:glycoside hydrolase family 3 C-terminal domain-containing protein [Streptomyces sp. MI02-2A]|uniref:glycoside hydrolase family 3 protein n=1 Tax=Streptomyces sp. MI02-2A TaxID=3028688 RepID=UPI0029BD1D64|nr:glycoside hydrolase family 3 C-terminal domain-containing protein [Streptomyces sp. MI02-2A]MDX3262641.1 glycoside hydrolase family 3 C-terminal domain-containing protein [Streptomyces sp. MI02-2A]
MKGTEGRRRTTLVVTLALIAGLGATAPTHADGPAYPFRDPRLPVDRRVEDLLSRLTPDEKISLLHQYEPAVPRLGIQAFRTGTEALHGVAWLGRTTVFPQAIGLASTWDPALIRQVGSAVGDEARGFQQERPAGWGLNLWAPVVNLLRDPRWGRNEEGYSEDPYLTGSLSTAYGAGLTGGDPDHLKTAPTLKHFLADNNEVRRDTTSSELRPRVLKEYDEQAFKPAIEADAATGVMSSYNLVNGRPNTVNPALDDTVRSWTTRDLLNVTDAFAPGNLTGSQKYYGTQAEADAAALKAGIDSFTDNDTDSGPTTAAIKSALATGLLKEKDVDEAVGHILNIRVRLGEFDPGGGPYGDIDASVINSTAHRTLARRAATEATVLLRNDGTLPLRKSGSAAVVGPLSDTLYTDWYSGTLPYAVTPKDGVAAELGAPVAGSEGVDRIALKDTATGRYVTAGNGDAGAALKETADSGAGTQFDVFDWGSGIVTLRSAANGKYVGYNGSGFVNDQAQPNGWFVQQQFALERQSDGTYLLRYAGYETGESWWTSPVYLGPAGADGTLGLVGKDKAAHYAKDVVRDGTAEAVAAVKGKDTAVVVVGSMPAINGREAHDRTDMALAPSQEALVRAVRAANPRTVVIVENSYPTTLGALQKEVPALLWTSHAGQETGHALADVLYGDANPAGRLTQTWYRSESDLPSILDYDIIKSDRTYQYFEGKPLYPFGYGLSYTSFRYGELKRVPDGYEVAVTNTGRRTGDEVVQLYVHQRTSRDQQPLKQLKAYSRVSLKPGETKTVRLALRTPDLAHWDVTRSKWVVETAAYDVMVGASSADIRARTSLKVRGETIPPRDLSRTTRAENFDDYRGISLADESKARGTAVRATAEGSWLKFADTLLGPGTDGFAARVAGAAGTVEVRLGSPTGTLAGTAHFEGTSSPYAYETVKAPLTTAAKGRRDVYLVLHGDLRLSTFSLR